MKKIILFSFLTLGGALALSSCKKEDPFVGGPAAPVLVQIVGAPFQNDFSGEPTVTYAADGAVTLRARILELDKTNLLDYTKGIDSVAVPNLKIQISLRNGTLLGEGTTDAKGNVTLTKTWAELGVAAPKAGSTASLNWSGSYKSVGFTRLSKIQAK